MCITSYNITYFLSIFTLSFSFCSPLFCLNLHIPLQFLLVQMVLHYQQMAHFSPLLLKTLVNWFGKLRKHALVE